MHINILSLSITPSKITKTTYFIVHIANYSYSVIYHFIILLKHVASSCISITDDLHMHTNFGSKSIIITMTLFLQLYTIICICHM